MNVEFIDKSHECEIIYSAELDFLPQVGNLVNFTHEITKKWSTYIITEPPELVLQRSDCSNRRYDTHGAICYVKPHIEKNQTPQEILLDIHQKLEYCQSQLKLALYKIDGVKR